MVDERTDLRTSLLGILGYAGAAAALAGVAIAIGTPASAAEQIVADLLSVVVLIGAGALIVGGHHGSHERMRSVFWFGAVGVWASAAAEFFAHGPDAIVVDGKWLVVVSAAAAVVLALPLWFITRRTLQYLALFAALVIGVGASVYSDGVLLGVTVPQVRWSAIATVVLGGISLALGALQLVRPKRAAMVLGALALIGGALFVDVELLRQRPGDVSLWLALVASVVVLLVGDFVSDRAVGGIGIAALIGVVAAIVHRSVLDRPAAVALTTLGVVSLAACVILARAFTRPAQPPPPAPPA